METYPVNELDAIHPVLHPAGSKAAKICSRQIFPGEHLASGWQGWSYNQAKVIPAWMPGMVLIWYQKN